MPLNAKKVLNKKIRKIIMAGKGVRGVATGYRNKQWSETPLWENMRKERERKEQEKRNLCNSLSSPDNDNLNDVVHGKK